MQFATMLETNLILIGSLLGLRFKVLILVPIIVVGLATANWIGISQHDSVASILFATAVNTTVLQLGYLAGTIIHWYKNLSHCFQADTRREPSNLTFCSSAQRPRLKLVHRLDPEVHSRNATS
jgi:hypothetical protein